ncbi:MAG: UvrD-helicase domain-containing protein [Zetaproteobacteria bacterium]|nr:UvrD-helicase domain-containing protein [Zetaproteobacteria bacterium]
MKVLLYNELNPKNIPNFKKMKGFLEASDYKSADVKKIAQNLYRCRLDITNRLLFAIYQYDGEQFILILEYIPNHAYDKSRFLSHGASIDESKIPTINSLDDTPETLVYLNPQVPTFNILDKVISFDDSQSMVYDLHPPVIIIGSAGSGKTALTLEKMKQGIGDILYITHSSFLVKNSRDLYFSQHYQNDDQQVDFYSFQEFLESIRIPDGREVSMHDFKRWFQTAKSSQSLSDPHQLIEEFKGVLTGTVSEHDCLSRDEYLALGIKQSIFNQHEREEVYSLFEAYLKFLKKENLYDSNMLSHQYMAELKSRYDFIVIDEVQDFTSVQLGLILQSLHQAGDFIICGDSNQIVHPNFFSWAKIKSFFYHQKNHQHTHDLITVLNTNYRNSPEVTEVANRLLKVKNARFGSIDKESNFLVKSNAHNQGNISFLQDQERIKHEIEEKTRHSTRFAIIVMHDEQKDMARKYFTTPLIFSVQEAKGLEYENIILYNFVSTDHQRFATIAEGVSSDDLKVDSLNFSRVKDKTDKSLEVYKFHINAFYVAITRAIQNLYIIESHPNHELLTLMGLHDAQDSLQMAEQSSCFEEWREEARKLELQGKKEQADEIRSRILKQKVIPWQPLQGDALDALYEKAIVEGHKKSKLTLFEYALLHDDGKYLRALIDARFGPSRSFEKGVETLNKKHFTAYTLKNTAGILRQVDQYGVDFREPFNHTPLMLASRLGNADLVEKLCEVGADKELINNAGLNAFQICLQQACTDTKYCKRSLSDIYELLAPAEITLKVEGRLIKLLAHTMEYTLLNVMIASFGKDFFKAWLMGRHAFNAKNLTGILEGFPDSIIPPHRKKRQYISSMLSKNEYEREAPYNRKIFKRIKRGEYLFNPDVAIRIADEWVDIYTLIPIHRQACIDSKPLIYFSPEQMEAWEKEAYDDLQVFLKKSS